LYRTFFKTMTTERSEVKREFKGGISPEDARRKREDARLSMRKVERKEQLHKRRMGQDKKAVFDDSDTDDFYDDDNMELEQKNLELEESLKELPEILAGIDSDNPELQFDKVKQVRKMLSVQNNPPIHDVIKSGIVPKLISFLNREDNPELQFEASWALTNVASGTTEHTRTVIDNGAVPIFIGLLGSESDDVREQAVWALGNIAGDSLECRNLVLEAGILGPLLGLCKSESKMTLLRNATWTLSNLCRGKPQAPFAAIKSAIPILNQLLFVNDKDVLTDACWAFSYITDDTGPQNEKITEIIRSGAVKTLAKLLEHDSNSVKHPALRAIGNIVTGDDLQTQMVIDQGVLPKLHLLLCNPKKAIRKEACWTVSNLTAGNVAQIEAVISSALFQPVITLLEQGEFDIKKEAVWAVSNATSGGTPKQIRHLVSIGCLPPLCNLLNATDDAKVIMVALEGLDNILRVGDEDKEKSENVNKFSQIVEECGGLDSLEDLQTADLHEHYGEIYESVVLIVRKYFGGEFEDEAYVREPDVDKNTNTFKFENDNKVSTDTVEEETGFSF